MADDTGGTVASLRHRCDACPWRDMDAMRRDFPEVVRHAQGNPNGFVCHTRCGPCDGPAIAFAQTGRTDD